MYIEQTVNKVICWAHVELLSFLQQALNSQTHFNIESDTFVNVHLPSKRNSDKDLLKKRYDELTWSLLEQKVKSIHPHISYNTFMIYSP